MNNMKNIDYWEKVINDSPLSYRKWFLGEKKFLRKNIFKNARVLDVGCGDGRSFNDIINKTQNLVGVDHEKKAIQDAKEKFKKYPKVKFVVADAVKLPFRQNEFDCVMCMGSMCNFGDAKMDVLREMKRVLKKHKEIIISVFSENAFRERMKIYKELKTPIKEIRGTTVIFDKKLGDNISEQFSRKQLTEMFNNVKLKVIEIKKAGIGYLCRLQKV